LRQRKPAEIVAAVPVAPEETCRWLAQAADRVVAPNQPHFFGAVGYYYANFEQVGDEEVRRLLREARRNSETWKAA